MSTNNPGLLYEPSAPGEWLAATDVDRLVLLNLTPTAATPARTPQSVWESLHGGDPAESLLGELTRHGLFETPPFALLTWTNDGGITALRAIVRGDVTMMVTIGEVTTEISGRGVSTWVERSFIGAAAFSITCGGTDTAGEASLPLVAGAAWTRRLTGTFADSGAVSVAQPVAGPFTVSVTAPVAELVNETTLVESTFIDAPPAAPQPAAAPETVPETEEPKAAGPTASVVAGASEYDHLFGVTMMRGVEQAAVRETDDDEPDPVADPEPEGDHDGLTVMSGDIRKLRDSRRLERRESATPAPAVSSIYLLLPSGAHETLVQPVLLGRAPSVSQVLGGQIPKLISIGVGDQDISRNHARFALEGDTVVVTDLHSRNGILVVLPGKAPQRLRQGEPTAIIVGTVVDLGSGITITVCDDTLAQPTITGD